MGKAYKTRTVYNFSSIGKPKSVVPKQTMSMLTTVGHSRIANKNRMRNKNKVLPK